MSAAGISSQPGLRQSRVAALAVAALGIYLEIVEWVDLSPWNKFVDGSNGQEMLDVALGAGLALLALALWRGGRLAALAATAGLAAWAWLQIDTFWIPFFQGASPAWRRAYEKWFGDTVHWIPASGDRLPPDANHLVLQILIVAALALALNALFAALRRPRAA